MMKTIFVILVVVLVYAHAVEDPDVLQKWTKFQADFGKSYRSPVEARKRFATFQDNLKVIEAHNNLFEKGLSSYTMGINQFSDWTKSEFQSFVNKGLRNETKPLGSGNFFVKSPNFVALASVDWRDKGAITPVKKQGNCGACWAFSATGGIEAQLAIKRGKLVSLSEQQLVDCSKLGNNGCNGGLMTAAYDYVIENGIDSEEDYEYTQQDGQCRAKKFQPVTKILGYVNIRQGREDELTEAIASKGPVSVGVVVTDFFRAYKGGIFADICSNKKINHAVLAVGYGSENGIDFYILKNSWGERWGENGYIRLARNEGNMCGVASLATYPQLSSFSPSDLVVSKLSGIYICICLYISTFL